MKNKFLSRLLPLCICLVLLCAVFASCTNTSKEALDEKEVKILTLAVGGELTTLYPLNMDAQNLSATRLCYEGLVNYEDGQVKPWLAKSWEFSEDGCALTFNLREDVTFHDGEKFNAQAVKANFFYKNKNPNFRAWMGVVNIKEIEVVDDYTLTFHYDTPYFGYLNDFAYREIMVCVSPKVIEEGNFQTMRGVIGTGPYVYSEVKDGEYVKFVKNENYWGEKPYYDEILVKYIPEASARLLALQKGEIDMIYGSTLISWDDYKQATSSKNIKGIVSPVDTKTVSLVLNAANPILLDKSVREAIAYGIDKQAICEGLSYGHQNPAPDLFPDGNFLSDVKLNAVRTYDKEKAEQLLDSAGWKMDTSTGLREKDGKHLSFKLTYDSGEAMNKMLATTVKSQLKEIGIEVQTQGQDMMTWWKEGVAGNYGMIIWGTEENTEPQIYFPKMINSSPHTPSLKAIEGSDKFLAAIEESLVTKDQTKVNELFTMILNFSNDNVLELPIYYVKDMILFNKDKIADYTFTDTPIMFEIDNIKPAQ